MLNENQKKPGLRQKLKNAIENISVDVFEYEKKITQNIAEYLDKQAKKENIPCELLFVQIVKRNKMLRVFLYNEDSLLKEIPPRELVCLFGGKKAVNLLGIVHKMEESVSIYMKKLSTDAKIPSERLHLRICGRNNKAIINAYDKEKLLKNISIKELVKYFKP